MRRGVKSNSMITYSVDATTYGYSRAAGMDGEATWQLAAATTYAATAALLEKGVDAGSRITRTNSGESQMAGLVRSYRKRCKRPNSDTSNALKRWTDAGMGLENAQ